MRGSRSRRCDWTSPMKFIVTSQMPSRSCHRPRDPPPRKTINGPTTSPSRGASRLMLPVKHLSTRPTRRAKRGAGVRGGAGPERCHPRTGGAGSGQVDAGQSLCCGIIAFRRAARHAANVSMRVVVRSAEAMWSFHSLSGSSVSRRLARSSLVYPGLHEGVGYRLLLH